MGKKRGAAMGGGKYGGKSERKGVKRLPKSGGRKRKKWGGEAMRQNRKTTRRRIVYLRSRGKGKGKNEKGIGRTVPSLKSNQEKRIKTGSNDGGTKKNVGKKGGNSQEEKKGETGEKGRSKSGGSNMGGIWNKG